MIKKQEKGITGMTPTNDLPDELFSDDMQAQLKSANGNIPRRVLLRQAEEDAKKLLKWCIKYDIDPFEIRSGGRKVIYTRPAKIKKT